MRDLLRRFQTETKVLRRELPPVIDRFRGRDAMKRVINFRRRKSFRIKRQHFVRGQVLRIKSSFPFGVLKTRSANPRLHAIAPSTISNLSFSFAKVVLPL